MMIFIPCLANIFEAKEVTKHAKNSYTCCLLVGRLFFSFIYLARISHFDSQSAVKSRGALVCYKVLRHVKTGQLKTD